MSGLGTGTIVATYRTPEAAEQADAALRRAGVPGPSIHRPGPDDPATDLPPPEESEGNRLWTTMFGIDEPLEYAALSASPATGGSVVRVMDVPDRHRQAVLAILARYDPAELQGD